MPHDSPYYVKEPIELKLAQIEFMKALRLLNQMAKSPHNTYLHFDKSLDKPAPTSFEVNMPVELNLLPDVYNLVTGLVIRNHFRKFEWLSKPSKTKESDYLARMDREYRHTFCRIANYLNYIELYSPMAWDYLLIHPHGQRLTLFILMMASVHQMPDLPIEKIRHIAACMVKKLDSKISTTPRRVEDLVLCWALEFLFTGKTSPGNIFAHYLSKLSNLFFAKSNAACEELLNDLHALPLPLHALPEFMSDYFALSFRLMLLRSINGIAHNRMRVFNAARLFSKPVFGRNALFDSHEAGYDVSESFFDELQQFDLSYSPAVYEYSAIKSWLDEARIIKMNLQGALVASEEVLSHGIIKQMLMGWFALADSNALSALFDTPEKRRGFWETPVVLLTKATPKQDDLFERVAEGLDQILCGLLQSQNYEGAYYLLAEFAEYKETKSKIVQSVAQTNKALNAFLWLLIGTPKTIPYPAEPSILRAKPVELELYLEGFKAKREALRGFHSKSLPPSAESLKEGLVKALRDQYEGFFVQIKPYLHYRAYKSQLLEVFDCINHLLQVLGASKQDFECLDKASGYSEYLCRLFQPLPKRTQDRKDSSVSVSIPISRSTPKADEDVSPLSSERDYRNILPKALLSLAAVIEEHFDSVLVLYGGAAASLYCNHTHPIHDYDCLLMDVSLDALLLALQSHVFPHPPKMEIIGALHPVLSLKFPSTSSSTPTEIQIGSFLSKGRPRSKALKSQLQHCDFKTTTLYLELKSGTEPLKMQGLKGSFKAIDSGKITATSINNRLFNEDAVRLLRLVKLRLKYPGLELSPSLEGMLASLDKKTCFERFFGDYHHTHNQGRIGSTLMNMLARFEIQPLLEAFHQLQLLEAMTGIEERWLKETAPIVVDAVKRTAHPYEKKLWFYLWLTSVYCISHPPQASLKDWPFYKVARHVLPEHRDFYDHIIKTLWGSDVDVLVMYPPLDDLIEAVREHAHHPACALG